MASNTLEIRGEMVWEHGNEVVPCSFCEDLIVSGSHQLFIKYVINDIERSTFPTSFIVCNSCYYLYKEEIV